jgi:filamentous hemagglutinin
MNLYDGTTYISGGVFQGNPGSMTFKPGASLTFGYIFGARDAAATNSFMTGDGNQVLVSIPTPWDVNAVLAITHAYGGRTAIEIGVAPPSSLSFGVSPWSHTVPVVVPKK